MYREIFCLGSRITATVSEMGLQKMRDCLKMTALMKFLHIAQ